MSRQTASECQAESGRETRTQLVRLKRLCELQRAEIEHLHAELRRCKEVAVRTRAHARHDHMLIGYFVGAAVTFVFTSLFEKYEK